MWKHANTSSLAIVAALAITLPGHAAWHESEKKDADKTTAKEVREEVGDAAEAIKNYSADKRDEAARKAKEALDALDARINALERQIDRDWEKMDKAAREQARSTLQALHKQRVKVAEWYGGLQNSTASAWEYMKRGFSEAYQSLKQSWEKAEQEYRENGNKEQK